MITKKSFLFQYQTIQYFIAFTYIVFMLSSANAQIFKFYGKVVDENGIPVIGANIRLIEPKISILSDSLGRYQVSDLKPGTYRLFVGMIGYKCLHCNTISIQNSDLMMDFQMEPDALRLGEAIVTTHSLVHDKTISTTLIDNEFLMKNLNGSLMKTLDKIPGVNVMEIGQGLSKPMIRGLSFNRVIVTENGIKQEGQQWGTDHGLEIDQYGIENIEIQKGPISLMYGSDAIAGVVHIKPNNVPKEHTLVCNLNTIYKSVNQYKALSFGAKYRFHDWYLSGRYTHANFGDYRVPADSFFYNRYRLPIYNNRLKNTAGLERNTGVTLGVIKNWGRSSIMISNVFAKTGFFSGAHGIPSVAVLADDGNSTNIDLPHQTVNHLKITENTILFLPKGKLFIDLGFQQNNRNEFSFFHSHYPTQPVPLQNPDLELGFLLNTYSADFRYELLLGNWEYKIGNQTQYQDNTISGYSFLIPEFNRFSNGTYFITHWKPTLKWVVNAGIRYDISTMQISQYFSEYSKEYQAQTYDGEYNDWSFGLGVSYHFSEVHHLKLNLGKSFRIPTSNELSANGVHHGSFRYELGNYLLKSEKSYQMDVDWIFNFEKFRLEISPFFNYFSNFIYLSPTGQYDLPDGSKINQADAGQVYQFVQSKALRPGSELSLSYLIFNGLQIELTGEYVFATDFEYPIPFTPPFNISTELNYDLTTNSKYLKDWQFRVLHQYNFAQNRIARNELSTPSSSVWNMGIDFQLNFQYFYANFSFQIQNLTNAQYFNHLNYYRQIELPEPGRNLQLIMRIPIEQHLIKRKTRE